MRFWERIQRNHGLEHGSISLLMNRLPPGRSIAGYSISGGFLVLGDVPTETMEECAAEALGRMKAGERELAISPFCGTNIVVGAALATIGTAVALRFGRSLSRAFSNAVFAIVASRPLGRLVQRHWTTSADVESMSIDRVTRHEIGRLTVHWVATSFAA